MKAILIVLYGRLHVCTQLHYEYQVISFAKSNLKGMIMFSVVLHELGQGWAPQSYLKFPVSIFLLGTSLLKPHINPTILFLEIVRFFGDPGQSH